MLAVLLDVLLVGGLKDCLQLWLDGRVAEECFECECGGGEEEEKVWEEEGGGFVYMAM